MQLWPPFTIRPATQILAAAAGSASSSTTYASAPPSSSTVFFSAAPAVAATERPASTLPVSVTAATLGSSISAFTSREPTSSDRNRFGGNPASRKTSSSARAHPGTFEACFRTAPLPAIRAGAAKRTACQNGKFHGMIASTTPKGL